MIASPPYEIVVDSAVAMLTATLRGFWDLPTALRYGEDLTAAAAQLAGHTKTPRWLVDLSGLDVQGADVTAHMTGVLQGLIAKYHPRTAIVLSRALVGVQTRRMVHDDNHRFFPTLDEAQAWLAVESTGDVVP